MNFLTDCVACGDGEAISQMVDDARQITRRTFLKYIDRENLLYIQESLGYKKHPMQGITMARDWAVKYWKSRFMGQDCVFFDHSAIEYIFV